MVDSDEKRTMLAHYYPFSRGTRSCIGQNLSLIEQKIVLAVFARSFDCGDVLRPTIDVEEAITVIIEDPMEVTLTSVTD